MKGEVVSFTLLIQNYFGIVVMWLSESWEGNDNTNVMKSDKMKRKFL